MGPFYIFDCNGRIVGNPKGYRTMRGATQQQDRKGSPAWQAIWTAYEERKKTDSNNTLVSSIHPMGVNA